MEAKRVEADAAVDDVMLAQGTQEGRQMRVNHFHTRFGPDDERTRIAAVQLHQALVALGRARSKEQQAQKLYKAELKN